jgi:hypothetical protein
MEPASFQVDRFELVGDSRLEVRGRWFGVRGRRFMRPALTAVAGGRQQRILAALDHKPWAPEEGETWLASFPCSTDGAALRQAELTVAPDLTVALPPPSAPISGRRRRPASSPRPSVADSTEQGTRPERHLQQERDEALRSREQACSERDEALRSREQARSERDEALRSREQASFQRDEARAARDEASSERDQACRERDAAQQQRNRMLAERDTARSRIEEATRRWELTAALGTRRTVERDAVVVERDRLARELEALTAEYDRLVGERDAGREDLEGLAFERDAIRQERDRAMHDLATHDLAARPEAKERGHEQPPPDRAPRDQPTVVLDGAEEMRVGTRGAPDAQQSRRRLPRAPDEDRRWAARTEPIRAAGPRPMALEQVGPAVRDEARPVVREQAPMVARDEVQAMWRARLLAVSALLVAFVLLLVLLLAK